MASEEALPSSAERPRYLLPRALQPVGLVEAPRPRFAWLWQGPSVTWELVLLDAALDEVLRVPGIAEPQYVADGALARAIAGGGVFVWYVQAELQGRAVRSLPEAFTFAP